MKVEKIALSQIKLNKANPRQIKDDKFNSLINSILVFPKMLELRPIVIDAFVALGGNMRHRALVAISEMSIEGITKRLVELKDFQKKTQAEKTNLLAYWQAWLDKPTALVVKADNLSDAEKQEFIIKDNVSFGQWDFDKLANEWDNEDLTEWGVDTWNTSIDELPELPPQNAPEIKKKISVIIPIEQEDNIDEIKEAVEEAIKKWDGVYAE